MIGFNFKFLNLRAISLFCVCVHIYS